MPAHTAQESVCGTRLRFLSVNEGEVARSEIRRHDGFHLCNCVFGSYGFQPFKELLELHRAQNKSFLCLCRSSPLWTCNANRVACSASRNQLPGVTSYTLWVTSFFQRPFSSRIISRSSSRLRRLARLSNFFFPRAIAMRTLMRRFLLYNKIGTIVNPFECSTFSSFSISFRVSNKRRFLVGS